MKTSNLLSISVLLISTTVFAQTNEINAFTIPRGAKMGKTVRILKSEPVDSRHVFVSTNAQQEATLNLGHPKTNLSVVVSVVIHNTASERRNSHDWQTIVCEYKIRSETSGQFEWNCLQILADDPSGFQILKSESENCYAFYKMANGICLFRLSTSRKPNLIWESFFSSEPHPDALPKLSTTLLYKTIAITNLVGSQFGGPYTVSVDDLQEKSGELQLTLHCVNPKPQFTFALRDGKWVFVKP